MSQAPKPPSKLFILSKNDDRMDELYGKYKAFATRAEAMEYGRSLYIQNFRVHEYRHVKGARPRRFRSYNWRPD